MKMKNLIATAALFVALAAMTTPAYALTTAQAKKIKETVLSVPVPEMPATAADLVTTSEKKDREDVAVTVVRAVIAKHRAAAPVVVAAISKVAPEVSAAIVKAATQAVPEQKSQIVMAATTAAPSQAAAISTVGQSSTTRTVAGATTASRTTTRESAAPSEGTVVVLPGPINNYSRPAPTGVTEDPQAKTGPRTN